MVTQLDIKACGSGYWVDILKAIYTAFEARNVTQYAWDDSDGWSQSRQPEQWSSHLECWLDLGGAIQPTRAGMLHSGRFMFAARYLPDDDSVSQARLHAATRDAIVLLMSVRLPHAARIRAVTGAQFIGPYDGNWVIATVEFTLHLPR